jgi:hypothetical protein
MLARLTGLAATPDTRADLISPTDSRADLLLPNSSEAAS